jgi:hypothetical protein
MVAMAGNLPEPFKERNDVNVTSCGLLSQAVAGGVLRWRGSRLRGAPPPRWWTWGYVETSLDVVSFRWTALG